MKTKEAIEFVSGHLGHRSDCAIYNEPAFPAGKCDCGFLDNIQEVIELLQRGEKYEAMWNGLYAKYGEVFLNDYRNPEILLEERMENLEQKYFPKESNNVHK